MWLLSNQYLILLSSPKSNISQDNENIFSNNLLACIFLPLLTLCSFLCLIQKEFVYRRWEECRKLNLSIIRSLPAHKRISWLIQIISTAFVLVIVCTIFIKESFRVFNHQNFHLLCEEFSSQLIFAGNIWYEINRLERNYFHCRE